MEMIDVLKKLQEIAETKPELVKDAVENVERTNPKEKVAEGGMKDYLHGEAEKLSREEEKKVIYEPVKLEQNYRNFDYESPWEGTKYIKKQSENK